MGALYIHLITNGRLRQSRAMSKAKKQLLSSAPWRGEEQQQQDDKFQDARLRATKQPGSESTMYVPRKKSVKTRPNDKDDDALAEIDPELRYSFQRNFQVSLYCFLISMSCSSRNFVDFELICEKYACF